MRTSVEVTSAVVKVLVEKGDVAMLNGQRVSRWAGVRLPSGVAKVLKVELDVLEVESEHDTDADSWALTEVEVRAYCQVVLEVDGSVFTVRHDGSALSLLAQDADLEGTTIEV
jgi:hypothetical protein